MPETSRTPPATAPTPNEPPRYRSHQGIAAGTASLATDITHAVRDGYDLAKALLSVVDRTARRWPLLTVCAATAAGYLAAGRTPKPPIARRRT